MGLLLPAAWQELGSLGEKRHHSGIWQQLSMGLLVVTEACNMSWWCRAPRAKHVHQLSAPVVQS